MMRPTRTTRTTPTRPTRTTRTTRCHPFLCLVFLIGGLAAPTTARSQGITQRTGRSEQQRPADLIVIAESAITVDPKTANATAVAIGDGRILAVGVETSLAGWIGNGTRTIRLEPGQTLMPGLIESHGHFVGLGQSLMMLDLRPQTTWNEIVNDVAAAARQRPAGSWIIGRGWHQSKFQSPPPGAIDGYPVHQSLSAAVPDHPVLLTHASGHACFVNAAAMKRSGIDAQTLDPEGGEIGRDDAGEPTGLLREKAAGLAETARARDESAFDPADREDDFLKAVDLATRECWRYGITSFHDAGSDFRTAEMLRAIADRGELGVRLYVMIRDSNEALKAKLAETRVIDAGNGFLTIRAIKKSIDGALGPHGAWLIDPYEDLPTSRGLATLSPSVVEQAAQLAVQHDYQLCVHAIGDRANRETLNIYQRAAESASRSLASRRWRIEHAQHLSPEDIPRFGQLGVIAAVQAVHCTSDSVFVPQRLGYRRSESGAYPWRSLIDSGATLCNGTDAPVESLDPFASLQASVTRCRPGGEPFFPGQRMTIDEAIASYTIGGAQAAFEESAKGSITPGKVADLIVVDQNLRNVATDRWIDTNVILTMVGGKIVWDQR